jgi:hypothetical protein
LLFCESAVRSKVSVLYSALRRTVESAVACSPGVFSTHLENGLNANSGERELQASSLTRETIKSVHPTTRTQFPYLSQTRVGVGRKASDQKSQSTANRGRTCVNAMTALGKSYASPNGGWRAIRALCTGHHAFCIFHSSILGLILASGYPIGLPTPSPTAPEELPF